MSIDPDRQVVAAVNLTSGLFVAYLGVLKFGEPYVLAEDDVIGSYSGWVGFASRLPPGAGFTPVARVEPGWGDADVLAECRRAAAARGLTHPAALAVLDAFAVRIDGIGARAAETPGKGPGVPEVETRAPASESYRRPPAGGAGDRPARPRRTPGGGTFPLFDDPPGA